MQRILLSLGLLAALLLPAAAQAWWHADWAYRTKIVLDTGRTGVPLTGTVTAVPVAIRLHAGNFNFLDTRDNGADLRFIAGDDKTPLPFHIDIYDWVDEIGIVWVQVPKLGGADAPPYIWMYYGNPHATPAGDPKATYDADQTAVFHFAARQVAPQNSTAYANNAKSSTAAIVAAGYLDRAAHFDAASRIVIPPSPSLKLPAGGALTFSAWLKPDAPKPGGVPAAGGQAILTRQDGASSFSIGLQDGQVIARIVAADGTVLATPAGARLPAGDWHHLAVTVSDHVTIYLDGIEAASMAARLPALDSEIVLGAPETASAPATGGFVGAMDEVQISRVARSPAWVRLAALGQGPDSKLVTLETTDQAGAGGSEYLAILSMLAGSVTIDGWVVIGLIALLGFVSAEVMVDKALLLRRTVRANTRFLAAFHDPAADLLALDAGAAAGSPHDGDWDDSPLYAIYAAGLREARRIGAASGLSGLNFEVIRTAVDSSLLAELNRLGARMVLVTLAVSGAPFLGLLGTVIGIMITFGTVALKGDVNINTIAPGISAALTATATCMAVAIPALFG